MAATMRRFSSLALKRRVSTYQPFGMSHGRLASVSAMALGFLPMRAIGWDIAMTPSGPVCVEGNARWDPPKFGDVTPLESVVGRFSTAKERD
jgi:hypothetical protein